MSVGEAMRQVEGAQDQVQLAQLPPGQGPSESA